MRHKSEELMKQIMDYAEQFQLLNHRSPYTSEIADALGIVKSTVYKYLVAMNDRGMLSYRNGEIVTERTNKISLLTKPAAVLGSVSCGMPQLEEEYIEEYVSLPVSLFGEGEFFILRASGDSMIGAGINSGDMIVIRKQNTASDGDIVVALVDNESTLKRFFLDTERRCVRLHPENPKYPDIYTQNCTVAGVGCDEIVRANPRGRSYSRWHGFGATESPAINSSTVFISLIRLSDSLCRYYLEDY